MDHNLHRAFSASRSPPSPLNSAPGEDHEHAHGNESLVAREDDGAGVFSFAIGELLFPLRNLVVKWPCSEFLFLFFIFKSKGVLFPWL